jgi:uncharacterized phiE125 gp8 family phage protein
MSWDAGICWHLEQVTPPEEEPLTVAFVRDKHLRVTNGSVEDDYIGRLIRSARRECERFTRRALPTQTWALVASGFPCRQFEIPRPPLQTIDSITYIDVDGAEQTLDPALYQVSAPQGPTARRGRVAPSFGQSWPATRSQTLEAVTVTFTAGYVDNASPPRPEVPEDLTTGMLLAIGEAYKQRTESVVGVGTTTNPAYRTARSYWWGYRVF